MTGNSLFGNKGLSYVTYMKVESICETSTTWNEHVLGTMIWQV